MTVWLEAEKCLARSTGLAESGSVREHGFSTDLNQETEKLALEKAALSSGPAETGL